MIRDAVVPAPAARSGFGRWAGRAGYAALGLAVAVVLAFNVFQPIKVLPRQQLGPGFSLTDQNGRRVTSEDYRGTVTLYSFGYTRCSTCGTSLERLRHLRGVLAAEADDGVELAFATLSLDPAYDTPPRLAEAASALGIGPDDEVRWSLLTGDPARVKQIVGGGFGLFYELREGGGEAGEGGAVRFEPRFYLTDGWGIVRAAYRSDTLSPERLLRDIALIAAEARNQDGVGRLAYEAAHLFRCYP